MCFVIFVVISTRPYYKLNLVVLGWKIKWSTRKEGTIRKIKLRWNTKREFTEKPKRDHHLQWGFNVELMNFALLFLIILFQFLRFVSRENFSRLRRNLEIIWGFDEKWLHEIFKYYGSLNFIFHLSLWKNL